MAVQSPLVAEITVRGLNAASDVDVAGIDVETSTSPPKPQSRLPCSRSTEQTALKSPLVVEITVRGFNAALVNDVTVDVTVDVEVDVDVDVAGIDVEKPPSQ